MRRRCVLFQMTITEYVEQTGLEMVCLYLPDGNTLMEEGNNKSANGPAIGPNPFRCPSREVWTSRCSTQPAKSRGTRAGTSFDVKSAETEMPAHEP